MRGLNTQKKIRISKGRGNVSPTTLRPGDGPTRDSGRMGGKRAEKWVLERRGSNILTEVTSYRQILEVNIDNGGGDCNEWTNPGGREAFRQRRDQTQRRMRLWKHGGLFRDSVVAKDL